MKSEFIRTLKIAALAISGAAILSCTNLDEVNDRLDSLESRIQALETQLPTLNNNVTALTQIANSGIINGIKPTEEGDGYVITTVDGETYTLRQGSIGNTPLMSIDEDGYWIVSYDNGANYERITVGGQPVAAAGMTPKFQVGAEGQWQISYDGGKVFEDVKDTEGNTVTAVGEGSDFFQDLTYADGILHITLADGQELDVTVVPDFSCVIAGVDYNTPEMFEYGATKYYYVDIKGVAEAIVSAPAGWTAVLEGTEPTAQLTVTAPEAETKISADTRTDVSILAVSSKGYSAITKMKVGLSAEPVPANPVAIIQPVSDATTASSLSFTVTPNADATSWKYMLLKADAAAPATDADFADATEQTGTQTLNLTATADGTALAGNTEYAIYVLPINTKGEEVTYGAIASAKATTAMPSYDTYYAMYEAGLDITIAGNLNLSVDRLNFEGDVKINGTLNYNADAVISGDYDAAATSTYEVVEPSPAAVIAATIYSKLLSIAGLFIVTIVFLALFPSLYQQLVAKSTTQRFGFHLTAGLVALVAVPLVSLFAFCTIAAAPLAVIVMVAYAILVYLAQGITGTWLGHLITAQLFKRPTNRFIEALVGIVLLGLASLIPFLGWITGFLALLFGLGFIAQAGFLRHFKSLKSASPAKSAKAAK